jgi:hypothetical protein
MFEWMMDGCQMMVGWMNDNGVSNKGIYFHINCFCVCVCVFGFACCLCLSLQGEKG